MRRSLILLMVAGITMNVARASDSGESSISKLTEATQIETDRIYESAKPSELAQAFKDVLRRPNAKEALVHIFERSKTDAGRIYALTGLYTVDEREYRARLGQLNPDSNVKAMWYDVVRIFSVKNLSKMIEAGELTNKLQPNEK